MMLFAEKSLDKNFKLKASINHVYYFCVWFWSPCS